MDGSHDDRIARTREAYREAHGRFMTRLRGVVPGRAERAPADGGWSLAQIAWHVAVVNRTFAALMSGERPSVALPEGFEERPWADVVAAIPSRLEAAGPSVPPQGVTMADALAALEASALKIDAGLRALTPERGSRLGIRHQIVGTITLYQVGDWAVAHTIRHNAQAKRVLSSLGPSPSGGA